MQYAAIYGEGAEEENKRLEELNFSKSLKEAFQNHKNTEDPEECTDSENKLFDVDIVPQPNHKFAIFYTKHVNVPPRKTSLLRPSQFNKIVYPHCDLINSTSDKCAEHAYHSKMTIQIATRTRRKNASTRLGN